MDQKMSVDEGEEMDQRHTTSGRSLNDVVRLDQSGAGFPGRPYGGTSPEVHYAADYLARATKRSTIIEIGCGDGTKLRNVQVSMRIGIDCGENIAPCRQKHADWGEWFDADLSQPSCISLAEMSDDKTIVVCANLLDILPSPGFLLALLAACYRRGAIVLTSTLDPIGTSSADRSGTLPTPLQVTKWSLDEYARMLSEGGLPSMFCGYTLKDNVGKLRSIATIHDRSIELGDRSWTAISSPVAIVASFNEEDVIEEVVYDLVAQGCDVVVIDNWSTDRTWSRLKRMAAENPPRVRIERFPASGPALHYEWEKILHRKEEIAAEFPGRWILHTDADEIRRSPFPTLSLAEALTLAEQYGANRIEFTLINFRPIDRRPFVHVTLCDHFTHFEYGTRPGHFVQRKAWLQGSQKVDLASSGGHEAIFPAVRDFPYRFLLKHYPIRSQEHGMRKVIRERQGRWSPPERSKLGWHTQYDHYIANSDFTWRADDLYRYDENFWFEHGLIVMTDIAERRMAAAASARC